MRDYVVVFARAVATKEQSFRVINYVYGDDVVKIHLCFPGKLLCATSDSLCVMEKKKKKRLAAKHRGK